MLIATSDLIDLGIVYTLTHYPAEPGGASGGGSWEPPEPSEPTGGITFSVHLEPSGKGHAQASLGYDPATVDLDGLVVETPYSTLTLPEGVGAGSTFTVTFRGRQGVLTIGAAPPEGIPDVDEELGESFGARWEAG